jgi:hypothetical protein
MNLNVQRKHRLESGTLSIRKEAIQRNTQHTKDLSGNGHQCMTFAVGRADISRKVMEIFCETRNAVSSLNESVPDLYQVW